MIIHNYSFPFLGAKRLDCIKFVGLVSNTLHVIVSRNSMHRKNETHVTVEREIMEELNDWIVTSVVLSSQVLENRDFNFCRSRVSDLRASEGW